MTKAAITPGIQPAQVSNRTMRMEPQPLSYTARGGKIIDKITLQSDMILFSFLVLILKFYSIYRVRRYNFFPNLTQNHFIKAKYTAAIRHRKAAAWFQWRDSPLNMVVTMTVNTTSDTAS